MKKLNLAVTTLCLVAALAFVAPTTARADGSGPQGGSNSAPHPPPPPPIDWAAILRALMRVF
jgi:hypothetical protein